VAAKIVDYELGPGETYEGVWHLEGMSLHEEIVATAIYFIDRDETIERGEILSSREPFIRKKLSASSVLASIRSDPGK